MSQAPAKAVSQFIDSCVRLFRVRYRIRTLKRAVSYFIDSCGREYEFPAGGKVEFLTAQESGLAEALRDADLSASEKVSQLLRGRDWSDCYSLAIFGIRLGILGVRQGDRQVYRLGLLVMMAGSTKLDWRDTLGALAILEDCGTRLGVELQSEFRQIAMPSTGDKLQSVLDGFFRRDKEMRSVDAMGMKQFGDGAELTFKPRGMP